MARIDPCFPIHVVLVLAAGCGAATTDEDGANAIPTDAQSTHAAPGGANAPSPAASAATTTTGTDPVAKPYVLPDDCDFVTDAPLVAEGTAPWFGPETFQSILEGAGYELRQVNVEPWASSSSQFFNLLHAIGDGAFDLTQSFRGDVTRLFSGVDCAALVELADPVPEDPILAFPTPWDAAQASAVCADTVTAIAAGDSIRVEYYPSCAPCSIAPLYSVGDGVSWYTDGNGSVAVAVFVAGAQCSGEFEACPDICSSNQRALRISSENWPVPPVTAKACVEIERRCTR